ncbi:MAG TPA: metallophosphoesterase [Phycisphaerales bacterium]|nr:metallophosphoesterase [Phycisphaerales bacterium]
MSGGAFLNVTDPDAVIEALKAGAVANLRAKCRRGSIDYIEGPGKLIATGDLHDNPMHMSRVIRAAGLDGPELREDSSHLTLHEVIHSDRLLQGMDMSYRVLARAADLKARFPEHVHILLGNHELAQMMNHAIVKDGVRSVDAFSAGVSYVFGERMEEVSDAITAFIRSLPIALKVHTPRGDILCAHSLPPAAVMGRFDTTILSRHLEPEDYQSRGAAHVMTWGRGYDADGLEDLTERWGVWWFILGHEHAPTGVKFVPPNALVLNSDHEMGVYLPLDLSDPPRPEDAQWRVVRLSQ